MSEVHLSLLAMAPTSRVVGANADLSLPPPHPRGSPSPAVTLAARLREGVQLRLQRLSLELRVLGMLFRVLGV